MIQITFDFTPLPLLLSIFKLHYLNKGQLRTLLLREHTVAFKLLEYKDLGGSDKFPSLLAGKILSFRLQNSTTNWSVIGFQQFWFRNLS